MILYHVMRFVRYEVGHVGPFATVGNVLGLFGEPALPTCKEMCFAVYNVKPCLQAKLRQNCWMF